MATQKCRRGLPCLQVFRLSEDLKAQGKYRKNVYLKCKRDTISTLTIHPKNKAEEKLYLQLAKVLKSKINRETKNPYNPEFVKKILKGQKQIREGKGMRIKVEDLWK